VISSNTTPMQTTSVKVGEDILCLENFNEDEPLAERIDEAIQQMHRALAKVDYGTAKVTLELVIKKDGGGEGRECSSKISTALKASGERHSRDLTGNAKGLLVIERYEQRPLPMLGSIDGGRHSA
jgi:hypothetical protein